MSKNQPKKEARGRRFATLGLYLTLCPVLQLSTVALTAIGGSFSAEAQSSTAILQGTAKDSGGAVIPQAAVSIKNVETGVTRTTQTAGHGEFSVPSLQPGTYTVTVTHQGFETSQRTNVRLDVGSQVNLDLVLPVGSTTETVTVETTPGEIPNTDVTEGTVVEQKQVVDLPLNGRQFSQLIQLEPGVVPVDNSQASSKTANFGAGASNPSVAGQSNRSNIYFIDGAIDSDVYFGGFSFSPSVEDIQEFKAESHTDQAAYGLAMGAIVNVITRPGTNEFHGTVFEFVRNTIFNTQIRNFSSTPQPKLPYHLNQFGGSFGGPVLRNKLFFFANYEGGRQVQPSPQFSTVPTAAERNGDFSGVLPGGVSPVIYDPATYNPVTHTAQPFQGNQIPTSRINQGMLTFLNTLYPLPNTALVNGANNLLTNVGNSTTADQGSVRVDYSLSKRDNINGRYSRSAITVSSPGGLADLFVTGFNGQNIAGNWTHTYNATTLSQVTFAYNTLNIPQAYVVPGVNQDTLFQASGLGAGFNENPGDIPEKVVPSLGLQNSSYSGFTSGAGPVGPESITQGAASLSKNLGAHAFTFGGSYFRTALYTNYAGNGFDFSNKATWNTACQFGTTASATCPTYNSNAGDLGAGGDAVASLLLSLPVDATRNLGNSGVNLREHILSFFAQDTWNPTSKLTITYGLRWDFNAPITEENNRLSTYNTNTQNYQVVEGDVDLPTTLPAHVVVSNRHSNTFAHYTYFQPRLGVSYLATPKTVLRAGFGRTFDQWALPTLTASLSQRAWPSAYAQAASTQFLNNAGISLKPDGTPVTGQNPFYGNPTLPASPFPAVGSNFQDVNWQPASDFQWNAEVQQDFGKVGIFKMGYVGSESEHSFIQVPYDVAQPSTNPVKVYPDQIFGGPGTDYESTGTASYHSLQTQLSRAYSNGLVYNASFTWSKSIGLASCGNDYYAGCVQNPYNLAADRGLTSLDVPLVFTFNTAYELPFGKGKSYLSSGPASYILGGWQVNSIVVVRSGTVINPTNGQNGDQANVGGGTQRVNFVGNPQSGAPHTLSQWFNPAAFELPAFGTYGNAGLDSLRGPGYWDADFSLFKNIPIHDKLTFQFRAEAFDVFNHPNLSNPDGSFAGSSTSSSGVVTYNNGFNTITSTLPNSNRVVQLAGKLNF
ncbi:MAG: hypothetical protein HIU93_12355 [Acidobacteria bacterium]|nr:hypothetical protein [Acidobacteriota bacterium]